MPAHGLWWVLNPRANDGYYLARAFAPSEESVFEVREVVPEAWNAEQLDGTGVIVLADVARLRPPALREVKAFVQRGGGLMFFQIGRAHV